MAAPSPITDIQSQHSILITTLIRKHDRLRTGGTKAMAETIIKIDLDTSPYDNDMVHNRWHPDIPMAAMVKPGDDFIVECHD